MGRQALGTIAVDAPCPALSIHDGRYWCLIIEMAEQHDIAFGAHLKWRLGIGIGCYATDVKSDGEERPLLLRRTEVPG